MPELPEVETLRRSLQPLVGRSMARIRFSPLAPVETTTPRAIQDLLQGEMIEGVARWGKYLLISTPSRATLVLHLGMSGQLRFFPDGLANPVPHTHMEITFSDGALLRFIDARRFGTLSLTQTSDHCDNLFLQRLGLDYLDEALTDEKFIVACRRHQGLSLKSLMLHQGIAAGLGNIYACEALYGARLDPRRVVKKTRDEQLIGLLDSARKMLVKGIRYGGVSMRDYLDGNGHEGVMKKFLQVYDREGMPSLDGKGVVRRIVQNARSTWFVPTIQK
jgi:formamidopyrimidine-DNA glycosylase